ncbi:MAG: T9SS C-terminal target domain-containing protein [Cryomorphaceae bacterium]|nr:MAG: T9SS C-terminal target domain-containing protein [Cryomorphaceae bacterium]
MKTFIIYLMAAIAAISTGRLYAQECPQEVSTDPRNPSNPDRPELENTFFWFPHNGNNHNNFDMRIAGGIHYPSMASPFWNLTSLQVGSLVNLENSDFWPEDGWELLKVNFGYLNDGTQREILPSMPYMALYNKYTGTMRFLGMWPNASDSWQIIRFTVSLPKKKLTQDNNGADIDATNLLSIQGDAAQPLDQQTDENVYEIIAEYPGISNASFFFWFDMPVAYDPCVCYNDVAITLEASVESTWNLTIKGMLDAQVLQQGVPTAQNHSALVAKRIIGAAGATAAAIVTGGAVIQTSQFTGLLDIFSQRPGISNQAQSNIQLLQQTMAAAANVVYDPEKLEWRNTVTDKAMGKSDWDKLFTGVGSFLNSGVDYLNPTAKASSPRTSVVGSMTATGTATLNSETGDFVYWGVPGTKWTNTLEEVITNTPANEPGPGGLLPEVPLYNNPLGTFALLKTPTLKVKSISHNLKIWYTHPYPEHECSTNLFTELKFFFDSEYFKYYFNPILNLNLDKTEILASIVVKTKAAHVSNPFINPICCEPLSTINSTDALESNYYIVCGSTEEIDVARSLSEGINVLRGAEQSEVYTSPVPIDYINDMLGSVLINGSANLNHYDFFIRFTLKMSSFNIGKNSEPVRNTQIITFPVNAQVSNGQIPVEEVDLVNNWVHDYLGGPSYISEISGSNYFPEYISISGVLASSAGEPAELLSSSVIHLQEGANLQPDLRLAIALPLAGTHPQEPFSSNQIENFCKNQLPDLTYQANDFSAKAFDVPSPSYELLEPYLNYPLGLNARIFIYPNPVRSELTVRTDGAGIDRLTIFDMATRPVMQASPGGASLYRMDISGLAQGLYIVRAECGGEVHSEKLVVAR